MPEMTLRYYERKIGDKIFHFARSCETKDEAIQEARGFRRKGYKARVFPAELYFESQFQVFIYPEEGTI